MAWALDRAIRFTCACGEGQALVGADAINHRAVAKLFGVKASAGLWPAERLGPDGSEPFGAEPCAVINRDHHSDGERIIGIEKAGIEMHVRLFDTFIAVDGAEDWQPPDWPAVAAKRPARLLRFAEYNARHQVTAAGLHGAGGGGHAALLESAQTYSTPLMITVSDMSVRKKVDDDRLIGADSQVT